MSTLTTDPTTRIDAAAAQSSLLVPADQPHRIAGAERPGADAGATSGSSSS